jgi:hypothetical protein
VALGVITEPVCKELLPPSNAYIMVGYAQIVIRKAAQNVHLMMTGDTNTFEVHARTDKNPVIRNGNFSTLIQAASSAHNNMFVLVTTISN